MSTRRLIPKEKYMEITSPLDGDKPKFTVVSLDGEEGICKNFYYQLVASSFAPLTNVEYDSLLGKSVTIEIKYQIDAENEKKRFINAIVYNAVELGSKLNSESPTKKEWHYQMELSSWLSQLKYSKDCWIFQDNSNTTVSIIEKILGKEEEGKKKRKKKRENRLHLLDTGGLTGAKRDYTVMYNESDYNFILRLLDEEGIFWYFRHYEKEHKLVLSQDLSDTSLHPEVKDWGKSDMVTKFCMKKAHIPVAKYKSSIFNKEYLMAWPYEAMTWPYEAGGGDQAYHYPGSFRTKQAEEGSDDYPELMAMAANLSHKSSASFSAQLVYEGESTIRSLASGTVFTLHAPLFPDLHEQKYAVLQMNIHADIDGYANTFQAVTPDALFKMFTEEEIEKPRINGYQTAVVTGKPNDHDVDAKKYVEVKVRFHWDHDPVDTEKEEYTSAFIRVSMPGAGYSKGWVFTPHIGEEVVVSFEDGDPDRPLIVGSVYSPKNATPSNPKTIPTQSMIKSHGHTDANQIVFNDKNDETGKELFTFKAKKNDTLTVANDQTTTVDNDQRIKVAVDDTLSIGNNQDIFVGNNQTVRVIESQTDIVQGPLHSITVQGNQSLQSGGDQTILTDSKDKEEEAADVAEAEAEAAKAKAEADEAKAAAEKADEAANKAEEAANKANAKIAEAKTAEDKDAAEKAAAPANKAAEDAGMAAAEANATHSEKVYAYESADKAAKTAKASLEALLAARKGLDIHVGGTQSSAITGEQTFLIGEMESKDDDGNVLPREKPATDQIVNIVSDQDIVIAGGETTNQKDEDGKDIEVEGKPLKTKPGETIIVTGNIVNHIKGNGVIRSDGALSISGKKVTLVARSQNIVLDCDKSTQNTLKLSHYDE